MASTMRFDKWENPTGTRSLDIANATPGLTPIIPTSVSVSSGSATVSANGTVTFTSAANINLAGVFTSAYKHYQIVADINSTAAADTHAWFSNSGTSVTTGYYGMSQYSVYNLTTFTSAGGRTNGNGMYLGYSAGASYFSNINMNVWRTSSYVQLDYVNYSRSFGGTFYGGYGTDATNADGFKISAANSAVYTGTMTVYGFNQ